MKKEWDLIPKILSGEKVAEARWYKQRSSPWGGVKPGDIIYFKDSGSPVTAKAIVNKVKQYEISSNEQALKIMNQHAQDDLGKSEVPSYIINYITNKKYAVFVWFKNPEKVKPFDIDKSGFGMQNAWLTIKDVSDIIKT